MPCSACCPGAIDDASTIEESFADGLLEYPQYTRPADVPRHGRAGDPHVGRPRRRPRAGARSRRWRGPRARRPDLLPEASGERLTPREPVLYSAAGRAPRGLPNDPTRSHGCPRRPRNRRVNVLDEIVKDQLRTDLPELATGDTVKVSAKVVEGNRERIQVFEGTVMRLRGGGITRSITVRRIASRRRRRADVQDQQPAHREDRGRPPRRRPARPALLPARARRQGRHPARAPHERLTPPARQRRPDDPAETGGVASCPARYPRRRWPSSSRPSATSAASGTRASSGSSASTRSASRRPAGRSSRRP